MYERTQFEIDESIRFPIAQETNQNDVKIKRMKNKKELTKLKAKRLNLFHGISFNSNSEPFNHGELKLSPAGSRRRYQRALVSQKRR